MRLQSRTTEAPGPFGPRARHRAGLQIASSARKLREARTSGRCGSAARTRRGVRRPRSTSETPGIPSLTLGSIAAPDRARRAFAGIHFAHSLPEPEAVGADTPGGDLCVTRPGPPLTSHLQSTPGANATKNRGARLVNVPSVLPVSLRGAPDVWLFEPDGGDAGVARHDTSVRRRGSRSPQCDLSVGSVFGKRRVSSRQNPTERRGEASGR